MLSDMVRCIFAVLVTLALVSGPGVSGVYAASAGAKMGMAASSDMHSPGKCDDCGSAKANMSLGVCSAAHCSGFTVFPPAGHAVFGLVSADTPAPYDVRHITGRVIAPDPYPPRPTILS